MNKETRHKYIIEIINNNTIHTQKELSDRLNEYGVDSTQATISRDIKELNIVKIQTKDGDSQYTILDEIDHSMDSRISKIFKIAVLDIVINNNLLIIKTLDKAAGICSDYLDQLNLDGYISSIYSDNCLVVFLENSDYIDNIYDSLRDELI